VGEGKVTIEWTKDWGYKKKKKIGGGDRKGCRQIKKRELSSIGDSTAIENNQGPKRMRKRRSKKMWIESAKKFRGFLGIKEQRRTQNDWSREKYKKGAKEKERSQWGSAEKVSQRFKNTREEEQLSNVGLPT